ncbi:MAG: DMT family transporter [Candidatus Thermoplasmatota archaeon]|nr:DMT family transporter [Candidatus Thermoplasmatota archaeon]
MKKPYIALSISVISVSFAAIFIVSANAQPLAIAFYRLLFTTLLISPLILLNKKYRKEIVTLHRSQIITMVGIGIILAAHFAFWISSLAKTSVASSVILVTAHPIMVTPLAYLLFKEKPSIVNTAGILLSISGAIILLLGNYGIQSSTLEGNLLAILGGAAAGLYILGGRKMRKSVSTICYAFVVYAIASITLLIMCLLFDSPVYGVGMRDYVIILLMALVSGIFGHTMYNWSLKYVRAAFASVSLLGEPLCSSLLAFVLPWIGQVPTFYTILGGSFILIGIYLASRNVAGYAEYI